MVAVSACVGRFLPIRCSLTVLPILLYLLPLLVSLFLFHISRFVNWPVPLPNHIFLLFPMYIRSNILMTLPNLIFFEKLLTALTRQQPSDIHLSITRPILPQLIFSVTFSNSSLFQCSLFSGMFLVAFYGLFLVHELASKSTQFACSVVQYSNLTFLFCQGQLQGAKITITEYKHNTSRRPFDILLAKDVSSPFCPVTALFHYCNIRGNRPRPLFCHTDQTPISAR